MCVFVCVSSQSDLAGGQRAGDPDQIQRFEGDQDKADVGRQVLGALWVHEVVSGVAAGVFLVAHRGGQVYPGKQRKVWQRASGHACRAGEGCENQTDLDIRSCHLAEKNAGLLEEYDEIY